MGKLIKSIAVVLIFIFAIAGALYLKEEYIPKEKREAWEAFTGKENPAPPDKSDLKQWGLRPFYSELPIIMLDTKNQQILKEDIIWGNIAVLDNPEGPNDIFSTPNVVFTGTMKYRGASSYTGFDKPQFRIKFFEKEEGKSLDYPLFGMGEDSEWVLNGPFLDRSLLRNYLMYNLSSQIMSWAPKCRFCELFLDGRYQGVYLAVEPVTDGANRLRLSRFGLVSGATPYIVKRDRVGTEINVIETYGYTHGKVGNELSIQYPTKNKLTEEQTVWIERDISEFERVLYSDFFGDKTVGYIEHIDVNSFAEYYILNEFAMNLDAGALSTYAYKELEGKLQLVVWDFNNGFDNFRWNETKTTEFCLRNKAWFDRLLEDRAFVDSVVKRYYELREYELSDGNIERILTEGERSLGNSIDRNFAKWGYTFNSSMLSRDEDVLHDDPKSYREAVTMLKETIADRLTFLDEHITDLYKGCIN